MSQIVLYFLHSTSVLSFYIDVVLPLSILDQCISSEGYKHTAMIVTRTICWIKKILSNTVANSRQQTWLLIFQVSSKRSSLAHFCLLIDSWSAPWLEKTLRSSPVFWTVDFCSSAMGWNSFLFIIFKTSPASTRNTPHSEHKICWIRQLSKWISTHIKNFRFTHCYTNLTTFRISIQLLMFVSLGLVDNKSA